MKNNFEEIYKLLKNDNSFKLVINESQTSNDININGLDGSFVSIFVDCLSRTTKSKVIFVSNDFEVQKDIFHDLSVLNQSKKIFHLIEPQSTFRNRIKNNDNSLDWLLEGLIGFNQNHDSVLICNEEVFTYEIPKSDKVIGHNIKLEKNKKIDFDEFVKELTLNGFERNDYVAGLGQIAVRGGIIDIFPIGWNSPLRIEVWGDEIESIREFEIISQRSIKEFDSVEFLDSMFIADQNEISGLVSIIDYFDERTIIVTDESVNLDDINVNHCKIIRLTKLLRNSIQFHSFRQNRFGGSMKIFIQELAKLITYGYKTYIATESSIHLERFKTLVLSSINQLNDFNESNLPLISVDTILNNITWTNESLSRGFTNSSLKIAYFTEHEVFERLRFIDQSKNKKNKSLTLKELQDLNIGDFVVHADKGIGIFDGFQTISINDSKQDCARVRFADGDMLYVHLNYIGKLSKYSAQEGAAPVLSKLGSVDWLRRKERAKKRLKDIARDLIKLYAERKQQKGYAYPADTIWQKEFEASFIYEDTPDQSSATIDIKMDMEKSAPMDRLVCGDVGFGKTEVAIRAAFKAVQAGKQAAVLVPTTILAQQHFMSFKDRLSKYPVNVDVISRFRSQKSQSMISENIKTGKTDILIGTHRLLSKDIQFKNLGLLIVDEEHRFGVSHKEKLRQMKANVDTLTLTATPIPRTLNFSLMGARDLSLIETPPRNRVPVITEIIEWEDSAVVQAINNEIERGGQIFFVSDRIEDIEKIAQELLKLMPTLRVTVAHGQMKPTQLEDIMEKFIQGKIDVLVATKIIESGIDIPNANTILINRAHNFGLAELYQLRGRVGRSNTQAYCYLLIPPAHKLPQKALQRLQAIEEFTELGSGFKLSMRDLEIRGAGNLLGAEQSGFIVDIGFELFQKVLDEAVNELKINEFAELFGDEIEESKSNKDKYLNEDIAIEIDDDALFPADYIKSDSERFLYYKKLYSISNNLQLDEVIKEIVDKYGKLPKEASNLVLVVRIRIAALLTGFSRIVIKKNKIICEFPPSDFKDYYDVAFPQIMDYLNQNDNFVLKQTKDKLHLEMNLENRNQAIEIIWKIKRIIELNID